MSVAISRLAMRFTPRQVVTAVERCSSNLNHPVPATYPSCKHLQFDQPYCHPDRTYRIWISDDYHKCSNEHHYSHFLDQPHIGEGERYCSTPILPIVFCRNASCKPNCVSNRVVPHTWKRDLDRE